MNVSDNLNIQNVIVDLKKSLQDKRSELSQCVSSISDFERQLQILDISLKDKIETNMISTTRLAGLFSSLETVEKKRDNEMRFHSNLLRKLQICADIEKELRFKMHKETLNRLNNHIGIFNQMTEKSKISMHLGKGGEFTGTKEDIAEDMRNKMEQLKKIQESAPLERYEKIRSELKSDEHLVEASKETEIAISMAQKEELNLEEKVERAKEKIRQLERS